MRVDVKFNNVNPSVALKDFICRKSNKLAKFLKQSEALSWVIESKDKLFQPHLNISLNGQLVSIHSQADNPYVAASDVVDKARVILAKRHNKLSKNH